MTYQKFSDRFLSGFAEKATPNPPKACHGEIVGPTSLGGLGSLGDVPPVELFAPAPWFERAAPPAEDEPGYEFPCLTRRGRFEVRGQLHLHFCEECGAWGAFGYGVRLIAGHQGRWYCAAHRPGHRAGK
jgi:hypothetical protein